MQREHSRLSPIDNLIGIEQPEMVLSDGYAYFSTLINDIHHAKHTIDLEVYRFAKDDLGQKIASALIAASSRGVAVRLLVDGVGSPLMAGGFVRRLELAGIDVRVYHPLPWGFWQWKQFKVSKSFFGKLCHAMMNMNSRNHRKMSIIDGHILYIGSYNVHQCHLPSTSGGHQWRDTAIRMKGTDTSDALSAFDNAWDHGFFAQDSVSNQGHLRFNNTRSKRRRNYKSLLKNIARAQNRIWITNAYFVPDRFLMKKLSDAAAQGIDVRILLPKKSDVAVMPFASMMFYEQLIKKGVRIFEYLPSMLHAKSLIIDEIVLIGTSNLNHRSLLHDLEVDVVLRTQQARSTMQDRFLEDLKVSQEVMIDQLPCRVLYRRLLGHLCLVMRYYF